MQNQLNYNDILIQLTHTVGKSVASEGLVRIFKNKSYKNNDGSKSYIGYLNKLVE